MTKLAFNRSRFCRYAQWDLTLYFRFYRKMALLLAGTMLAIVLMVYLVVPAFRGFTPGTLAHDPAEAVALFMMIPAAFFTVVAMAYTFHGLLTTQSRILELTIPASTLERFVWHVLVVTVGTQLALCASVALADLVHAVLVVAFAGTGVDSIWMNLYVHGFENLAEGLELPLFTRYATLGALSLLAEMAFFMMVSAWKYRYSVLFAIVLKMVFGLAESLLLGVLFGVGLLDSDHLDWLWRNPGWAVPAQIAVIAAEVAIAYWLFNRAQVLTRTNPRG